ncbi:MAG: EAL domain-containing protein, partial [Methanobacterium sp.]|nr:EAL domain-containing protein [Methanobacterium sp.]
WLEDLPVPQHAAVVAQSLINTMQDSFTLASGQEIYIGTSIGISIFPDDGDVSNEILRNADAALYQAKGGGRATFRFYTEAMSQAANVRVELEAHLRHALTRQEFLLHYQPLVSLEGRRVVGVEALLRWNSPANGMILPGQFIPLAEETSLIVPLGTWVLRTSCAQMVVWIGMGVGLTTMAVNLSPVQFAQSNIVDVIRDVLNETGLPPGYLELEITEGALMEPGPDLEAKLASLRALGVRLSIDDFGTGYSSLAYLKKLPINKLKIDRSFVADIPTDPADMEITAAVVGLAKNLHLEVLAEGVETEDQLSFLHQLGCHSAQGYLLSPPLPESEIGKILGQSTFPGWPRLL